MVITRSIRGWNWRDWMSSHDTHDHDREGELKRRIERHVSVLFHRARWVHNERSVSVYQEILPVESPQGTKLYYTSTTSRHRVLCEDEDDATLFKQEITIFFRSPGDHSSLSFPFPWHYTNIVQVGRWEDDARVGNCHRTSNRGQVNVASLLLNKSCEEGNAFSFFLFPTI